MLPGAQKAGILDQIRWATRCYDNYWIARVSRWVLGDAYDRRPLGGCQWTTMVSGRGAMILDGLLENPGEEREERLHGDGILLG